MIKVSDYIISFLTSREISRVYTVSGGGCIHLIDSLKKSANIQTICVHHEQAAAMAAEGDSRISNKPGMAIVTSGPGGINALNGVFGCWTDSIPCVFISGQVSLNQTIQESNCRQIGDQEYQIISAAKTMTKYAVMIEDKNTIRYHLEKAFFEAENARPGPVWIDIPLDIQGAMVDEDSLVGYTSENGHKEISEEETESIFQMIISAKKPLIVVGNGIKTSNSLKLFYKFLEKTGIPVMTNSHSAIDAINESYPFYTGRYGILGQRSSNQIIQECDLLFVLGSRLIPKSTGYNVHKFAKNAKKIVIDIDLNELNKHKFDIDLKLQFDIRDVLSKLLLRQWSIQISDWQKYCQDLRKKDFFVFKKHYELEDIASAYVFIEKLAEKNKNDYPIVTSNGAAHVITQQSIRLKRNQKLFTNVGCASMGYGLPAAIGACFANDKKPVICIEGDGSIMMNIQELQTVKHYDIPLKIFIINNDGYISIKQTQNILFNGNYFASGKETGVSFPDFKKIANAFDLKFVKINNNSELDRGINECFLINGPVLCEIITHPREYFEPKVIHKGIDENGRIIPGELTDMSISETF